MLTVSYRMVFRVASGKRSFIWKRKAWKWQGMSSDLGATFLACLIPIRLLSGLEITA